MRTPNKTLTTLQSRSLLSASKSLRCQACTAHATFTLACTLAQRCITAAASRSHAQPVSAAKQSENSLGDTQTCQTTTLPPQILSGRLGCSTAAPCVSARAPCMPACQLATLPSQTFKWHCTVCIIPLPLHTYIYFTLHMRTGMQETSWLGLVQGYGIRLWVTPREVCGRWRKW